MSSELGVKNEKRPAVAAAVTPLPPTAARRPRKIVLTQEEIEGYKRIVAAPEPPTEKLRSLLLARRGTPQNEI